MPHLTMKVVRRIGPYGVIAAICAAVNLVILLAGEAVGVHYGASITLSFAACVLLGYLLHCRFTFATVPNLAALGRYTAAMSLNYPLSIVTVWLFRDVLDWPMVLAAPASTLTLTAYNFLSSHWALVRSARWNANGATRR